MGNPNAYFRCDRKLKRGWYCRRPYHYSGPCALVPRWWNVLAKVKYYAGR